MSIDREAPTPRITHTWSDWASRAADIVSRARDVELQKRRVGPELDPRGERLARTVRQGAEWYLEAFRRWLREDVPYEVKQRELRAFERFDTWSKEVLCSASE